MSMTTEEQYAERQEVISHQLKQLQQQLLRHEAYFKEDNPKQLRVQELWQISHRLNAIITNFEVMIA